jgi:O-antigen ligase
MDHKSKSDKLIQFYFLISILIFSFCTSQSSYLAHNIIVPYIPIPADYIHFGISLIMLIGLIIFLTKKYLIFHSVCCFLFAWVLVCLVPIMYIDETINSLGRITVPIISMIAFFIGLQYKSKLNNIINIIMLFTTILSLQTIYTVKYMIVPHTLLYAQYIKIPLASSNLIAAFIVPSIFLILIGYSGKWYIKWVVVIISLIAVILSTSDGAILVLFATLMIYFLFIKNKLDKKTKLFLLIMLSSGFILFVLINYQALDEITHHRYGLIVRDLKLWMDHIIFGNGMHYEGRESGTHNILVDLLVQNGIVGFILYICSLIIIFKEINKNKNKQLMGLFLYLIATFIHSLGETSYFNYSNDMLFWFIAGVAVSQVNYFKTINGVHEHKHKLVRIKM